MVLDFISDVIEGRLLERNTSMTSHIAAELVYSLPYQLILLSTDRYEIVFRTRMRPNKGEFTESSEVISAAKEEAMPEPRECPHKKTEEPDLLMLHLAYSKTALHGKLSKLMLFI